MDEWLEGTRTIKNRKRIAETEPAALNGRERPVLSKNQGRMTFRGVVGEVGWIAAYELQNFGGKLSGTKCRSQRP